MDSLVTAWGSLKSLNVFPEMIFRLVRQRNLAVYNTDFEVKYGGLLTAEGKGYILCVIPEGAK